jgi:hypothetical protein
MFKKWLLSLQDGAEEAMIARLDVHEVKPQLRRVENAVCRVHKSTNVLHIQRLKIQKPNDGELQRARSEFRAKTIQLEIRRITHAL